MFGCHNCCQRPRKDDNYEETECAQCRAAMDPAILSGFRDDELRNLHAVHPACTDNFADKFFEKQYGREEMAAAISKMAKIILRLKSRSHSTWRILEMKINRPELSYSQLAEIFSCRKQNIQYHLRKISHDCPELSCLLGMNRKKHSRTAGQSGAAAVN